MKKSNSISIDLNGIGRILFNKNVSVPIYQRSYAWEEEHVSDLFNDISQAMSDGAYEYFIGSIVTTQNDSPRAELADGQQRLATVTILLAAIRDWFYETGDQDRAGTITSDLLHKKDLKTLNLIPKLKLNDTDNDFFTKRVLLLPGNPDRAISIVRSSHHRIDKAAQIARKHVTTLAAGRHGTESLTDLVEYLTDSVKVIWVRVPDDANAFMVFETLNDRGLALAITDLLKNHLFGLSGSRLSEVQQYWIGMTSALEFMEEDNAVLTFLRHYWSSREGLVREKDLYADIKRKINNQSRAVTFAGELETNAHIYAALVNTSDQLWAKYGDTCRKHMETLNTLRLTQIRPLLLSILDKFAPAEVKKAVASLLGWSVRFLIHGGLGSGAIESHNCAAAKEVRAAKIATRAQLFQRLQGVIPNDAQFRAAFATSTVSKAFLARYYLRALERQCIGVDDPELVPNDNTEDVNLEHVLPQRASKQWAHIPSDEHAVLLKRLGNLVLLRTKINAKAGNDSFTFKKQFYSQSQYELTKRIATENNWDREAIDKRQNYMADLAVKTWALK